jgi:hypothetical protein
MSSDLVRSAVVPVGWPEAQRVGVYLEGEFQAHVYVRDGVVWFPFTVGAEYVLSAPGRTPDEVAVTVTEDAGHPNGGVDPATAVDLGVVRISGTPTDAASPQVYVKESVDSALAGKAPAVHTHDDRYFTESETTAMFDAVESSLAGKADSFHTHAISHVDGLALSLSGKAPLESPAFTGSVVVGDGGRLYFADASNRQNIDNDAGTLRFFRENADGTAGAVNMSITDAGAVSIPRGGLSVAGTLTIGADVNLYRSQANVLKTDDGFIIGQFGVVKHSLYVEANTGGNAVEVGANTRAEILFSGDTNLYRSAADTLKTDDALIVTGATRLANGGTTQVLSFYGAGGSAKQTVTGSAGGNVALSSLLNALHNLGLITNSASGTAS